MVVLNIVTVIEQSHESTTAQRHVDTPDPFPSPSDPNKVLTLLGLSTTMPTSPGHSSRRSRDPNNMASPRNLGASLSSSRPFLNMINPMTSRTYQGYIRADQSPVEEENEMEEQDLESGRRSRGSSSGTNRAGGTAASTGGRLNERDTLEKSSLRPNIKRDDEDKRGESSDDEVPQSFIIETPATRSNAAALNRVASSSSKAAAKGKGKARSSDTPRSAGPQRGQPLYSVAGRRVPPILPVSVQDDTVSIPPRPSELDEEEHVMVPSGASNSGESSRAGGTRRQARGTMGRLDPYERALWNWVNVYNLDAFLQEVYYYYEGKGIYSIALARGLNLLLVFLSRSFQFSGLMYLFDRTMGFVIGFSTFLLGCVDYSRLQHGSAMHLSDIIVHNCVSRCAVSYISGRKILTPSPRFSGLSFLFFLLFLAFYIWQIISFILDIHRLIDMYHFYTYLLKIPDVSSPI